MAKGLGMSEEEALNSQLVESNILKMPVFFKLCLFAIADAQNHQIYSKLHYMK